jgi:hypothetical protein
MTERALVGVGCDPSAVKSEMSANNLHWNELALAKGRPMRFSWTAVAVLVGSSFVAGCGTSPTIPSHTPSVTSTTPSPAPTSAAVLSVSRFTATAVPTTNDGSYKFGYLVRFALAETGGKSGATIQNIETAIEDRFNTGAGCWRDTLRVPPGGTLETFNTDAGEKWLSYCAPDAASRTEASRVSLVVTFTDDDGRSSAVQATTSVTR